jgi:uncharacterized protein (TIGR03067 family)
MLRSWLVLCTLILPVAALPAQEDAVKKEKAKLAGVWIVESVEFLGKQADSLKGDRFIFTAEKLTITSKAKDDMQSYQIDPTKKPKEVDFKCEDMAFLGIYELNGDTLRLCLSTNGARPTAFDSKQGLLSLLKRSKK